MSTPTFSVHDVRRPKYIASARRRLLRPRSDIKVWEQEEDSKHRAKMALYEANYCDFLTTKATEDNHRKFIECLFGEVEHYHRRVRTQRQRSTAAAWCREVVLFMRGLKFSINQRLVDLRDEPIGPLSPANFADESIDDHAMLESSSSRSTELYVSTMEALSAQRLFDDTFIPNAVKLVRGTNRRRFARSTIH